MHPAATGRGLARLIGLGIAARIIFVLSWLVASERSPIAQLVASPTVLLHAPRETIWATARLLLRPAVMPVVMMAASVLALRALFRRHARLARAVVDGALGVALIMSLIPLFALGADALFHASPPTRQQPWERGVLLPISPVRAPPPGPSRYPRVFLVLMESVSATAASRSAPEGSPLRRLRERAARFDETVSTGNVSHLGQPAILTSHDFGGSRVGVLEVRPAPQPTLGIADWFNLAGYHTVAVSSQDERWLGIDRIVKSQHWDSFVHSMNFGDDSALYRDICGVTKVLDSRTIDRFIREIDAVQGPVFGYLNLQNTHFPYLSEAGGRALEYGGLSCVDVGAMPEDQLDLARRRHEAAVAESFGRVAALVDRYPDALFVLVGDHGEDFVAGPLFGHGKSAALPQIATFSWFIGPGLTPGPRGVRASVLDVFPTLIEAARPGAVAALPRGILSGRPLWTETASATRMVFAEAVSVRAHEQAVILGDRELWTGNGEVHCLQLDPAGALRVRGPIPINRCADMIPALGGWRECQASFSFLPTGERARSYNPCQGLFEYGANPRH